MIKKIFINIMKSNAFAKTIKWITNTKFSSYFIPTYKRRFKIKEDEIVNTRFKSLNDFFTRRIDLKKRPLGNSSYVSPCDGMIVESGDIKPDQRFFVKGKNIDIKTLVGKEIDVSSFAVIYLSPSDYHRFHAIANGEFSDVYELGKTALPVNDLGFKLGNPFLKNHRIICESKDYYYIAVGATNVNSIVFTKRNFLKGEEIGYFEFGSTIILLFKKNIKGLKHGPIKVLENLTL